VRRLPLYALPVIALACLLVAGVGASAQSERTNLRTLSGHVIDGHSEPLAKAVVYLKNTKTLAINTSFTEADGSYRFPALSANVDYEVHAEYKGITSDTKTLSAFDSRREPTINLKIRTDK